MVAKQYVTKQPMDHWKNKKGNQKIPRDQWKWKHNKTPVWCSTRSSKRDVYNDTILPQETRKKSQINHLTLHLQITT